MREPFILRCPDCGSEVHEGYTTFDGWDDCLADGIVCLDFTCNCGTEFTTVWEYRYAYKTHYAEVDEDEDYIAGWYTALGVLMGMSNSDGTYTGDSSTKAAEAAKHVKGYSEKGTSFRLGFVKAVYSMHRCG